MLLASTGYLPAGMAGVAGAAVGLFGLLLTVAWLVVLFR
jgi:hypothetical protein